MYADGSLIKPNESLGLNIESDFFKVSLTDKNGIEHESNQFNIDFANEVNIPIKISASLDSLGNWIFTRIN